MLEGQWIILDVGQNAPETVVASFYADRDSAESAAISQVASGAVPASDVRIVQLTNAEVLGFKPEPTV